MIPTYNKLVLGKKARDLGFVRDAYEKMNRLAEILQFVNSDQELSPLLALKGGTAINLAVFNLPRLSVDIDFDFAENLAKEETAAKRERINVLLGRYMASEGYAIKGKSKHTHALDSLVYSYTNAAGNPDNIKIEINYILRNHVLPVIETTTQTGGALPDFPVRTLSPVEIFAGKIVALSDRAAARDLYDLYNMIHFELFEKSDLNMLRKCVVFYLAIVGDATHELNFSKLDTMSARVIKTDLYPMIRNTERFDFVSAKDRVSRFLIELFAQSDKDVQFLQRFLDGYYEPQLLVEDNSIISRVENHPMAIWRLQQINNPIPRIGAHTIPDDQV